MKKSIALIICILLSGGVSAQTGTPNYLKKLSESIKNAQNYSFGYKSGDIEGEVSIAKNEMYMSQKEHLEIYEKDTVRYSYNVKRKKVDIDALKRDENGGAVIFNWLRFIDDYKILSRENSDTIYTKYTISRDDENIVISFKNSILDSIQYENNNIPRIKVEVRNFQINKKQPSEYFTFDPSKRTDLEVTDYR